MKKFLFFSFLLTFPVFFFSGCGFIDNNFRGQLADPPVVSPLGEKKSSSKIPPAQDDPGKINITEKVPKTEPVKTVVLPKKEISAPVKTVVKTPQPVVPQRTAIQENYRRGPGMWRAFNRLSTDEKKQLLSIQRSDPEKFRKILHEKADKLYEAEKIRQKELDDLVLKIKTTEGEKEKENLKAVLRKKLKEDFQQRLQDTRKDIEAYKRRTAKLESELQKREKNCDAIVDAILNKRLNSNL